MSIYIYVCFDRGELNGQLDDDKSVAGELYYVYVYIDYICIYTCVYKCVSMQVT
jgi:hypothetical protein